MSFKIEGSHNTATVFGDRNQFDQTFVDQVQEMVNSKSLYGDDDIKIMPDGHAGAGAVIGFTMPVKERIVPNVVGVDCGCGMYAVNYGNLGIDFNEEQKLGELDQAVRNRVPTGFDVHDRNDYHMIEDFPWDACKRKLTTFDENTKFDLPDPHETYDESFFEDVCKKVGYDMGRGINSVGTLGGGNHFIEFGSDLNDDTWCVIHSGSRGIGANIAQYWQEQATNKTTMRQSIDNVPVEVKEYMTENWKPKASKIRNEFSGKDIQNKFDEVSQAIQEYGPSTSDRNTDLDYLQGDEAVGYIVDMIFAQTYASESRKKMMSAVDNAIDSVTFSTQLNSRPGRKGEIESVHNYIDFEDATIRKGACRAHDAERLVVPFNMSYGTIIARGIGDASWNRSSAHGAGRAMSRSAAERQFDDDDFSEQTDGVYMSETPMDEIPGAYKSPEDVESALGENVTVVNRIEPFLSIKAA
jgi:RNA-splicing ligase RtcB